MDAHSNIEIHFGQTDLSYISLSFGLFSSQISISPLENAKLHNHIEKSLKSALNTHLTDSISLICVFYIFKGRDGSYGAPGPVGQKGDRGLEGLKGLDGRPGKLLAFRTPNLVRISEMKQTMERSTQFYER